MYFINLQLSGHFENLLKIVYFIYRYIYVVILYVCRRRNIRRKNLYFPIILNGTNAGIPETRTWVKKLGSSNKKKKFTFVVTYVLTVIKSLLNIYFFFFLWVTHVIELVVTILSRTTPYPWKKRPSLSSQSKAMSFSDLDWYLIGMKLKTKALSWLIFYNISWV